MEKCTQMLALLHGFQWILTIQPLLDWFFKAFHQAFLGVMALVLIRHGERQDYVDTSWIVSASRPWDPPLTEHGKQQAKAAGESLKGLLHRNSLPPVTKMFTSPLTRCVETALGVADTCGYSGSIGVEPSLMEIVNRHWYHSWGVPGANAEWGGPPSCRVGTTVPRDQLHPGVFQPSGNLLQTPEYVAASYGTRLDLQYSPVIAQALLTGSWDHPESEEQTLGRLEALANHCAREFPEETVVLVTHGGPTILTWRALCGDAGHREDCPYTAIFVLLKNQASGWRTVVSHSICHLGSSDNLGLGTVAAI